MPRRSAIEGHMKGKWPILTRAQTKERREKVKKMWLSGLTLSQIAEEIGVTKQRVHAILKAYEKSRWWKP